MAYLILTQIQAFSIADRVVYGEWLGKPGDKLTQAVNILQILLSTTLVVHGRKNWQFLRDGGSRCVVLSMLLAASFFWSVEPAATARTSLVYFFTVLGAVGAAETVDSDDFMHLVALICFLSAVASLFALAFFPNSAGSEVGEFRGIFSQKNVLGQAMAIGVLACLHRASSGKRHRYRIIFMMLVMIGVAFKSESATSCFAILLFCGLRVYFYLVYKSASGRILANAGVIIALFVAIPVIIFPDSLFAIIGKDPTLTGRTNIWDYVLLDIYERPWLGWGYAAFWSPKNPAAMEIGEALHWFAPQAHNGLLEILINLGVIGALGFIYLWVQTTRLSLLAMRTPEKGIAVSCFSICCGIILVGITEAVLLFGGGIAFIFFTTGFYCERAARRAQRQRAARRRSDASNNWIGRPVDMTTGQSSVTGWRSMPVLIDAGQAIEDKKAGNGPRGTMTPGSAVSDTPPRIK